MGTRHYQKVISKKGEVKLAQYGQWDGYPSGQGIDILEFLRNCDMKKYHKNLVKLRDITDKEAEEVEKDENWPKTYPYLSRDCGAKIHKMIENGAVPYISLTDQKEANQWCEGFYTIDFSKNLFISEFHGNVKSVYKLDSLPTNEEYLMVMSTE